MSAPFKVRDYAIGSRHLPGLGKFTEEVGEALKEVGKIQGIGHLGNHWDGKGELKTRIENELADVWASIDYFVQENGLDKDRMKKRSKAKVKKFMGWHNNIRAGRSPNDNGKPKKPVPKKPLLKPVPKKDKK